MGRRVGISDARGVSDHRGAMIWTVLAGVPRGKRESFRELEPNCAGPGPQARAPEATN